MQYVNYLTNIFLFSFRPRTMGNGKLTRLTLVVPSGGPAVGVDVTERNQLELGDGHGIPAYKRPATRPTSSG
jgi:hypothetical protein